MSPQKNIPYKFILSISLFFIADFVVQNINHRFLMSDLKVYYQAANALVSNAPVYGVLFSLKIGFYKYSPFTAMLFYPLSLLPFYVSCVIYFLIMAFAIVYSGILILRIFNTYVFNTPAKSPNLILSLGALSISSHLVRELVLGNVNILLLLLLCLTILFIIEQKTLLPAIFLALVIITKPFFILLFLPLLIRRHFKILFISAISLALFIISPALIIGIGKDIQLHKQWLNTMLLHAGTFPSPNTIAALTSYYLNAPAFLHYTLLASVLLIYILFVKIYSIKNKTNPKASSPNFIIEWFILIALTPCLFPTDTEHFLLSLPLILFILLYLSSNKNIPLAIFFTLLIILYAGNSTDLLGKTLSSKVYNMGLLGISNLLIITLTLFVYLKKIKPR